MPGSNLGIPSHGDWVYHPLQDQWVNMRTGETMPYPPIKNATLKVSASTCATIYAPKQMLAMRMRLAEGSTFPFEYLEVYANNNVAVVFLVNKGQPSFIEDDPHLFPSDALVTKLRLLIG